MDRAPATLEVQLHTGEDADAEELDQLTANLHRELLELEVGKVERPRTTEPPPGARAAEVAELGSILVTLAPTVLAEVVRAIGSWLSRSRGRTARVQVGEDVIEITGASTEQQERLISAFISRHAEA